MEILDIGLGTVEFKILLGVIIIILLLARKPIREFVLK